MDSANVGYTSEVDDAVIDVRVSGRWGNRTAVDLAHGLRKCLAECPRAIVVDLQDLVDPAGSAAPVLLAAQHAAARTDPPVHLMLCAATDGLARVLKARGLTRSLPTYPTSAAAHAAVAAGCVRPAHRRAELLAVDASIAEARNLAGQLCADWNLLHLCDSARLIASEFATNAVRHAGTPFTFVVSRRGRLLHLAARDQDPRLPPVHEGSTPVFDPLAEHGRGLLLVAVHATAWGAMRCRAGKVVWATLSSTAAGPA
jgi:anti-anti-sigma regulatory factor